MNIGDKIDCTVTRNESNFDRACDEAYRIAIMKCRIDEDGHSDIVGWERSCCWIEMEFIKYIRIGRDHIYTFEAKTIKEDEEEEDEEEI